jgi:UrcA family protein
MLSMKSVASALVLVASAADVAVPVLIAPALVIAASTAARAETPAQETSAQTVRQQVVSYGDLNLATPSGQATFQARLKSAVQAVCGPQADLRSFEEAADYKACVAKASREAMSALPDVQQQAARSAAHAG